MCIGAEFVHRMYCCEKNQWFIRDCVGRNRVTKIYRDERNIRQETVTRNWTHHLINLVRYAIRQGRLPEPVKIITFNYDCVLEHVLKEQFQNTEAEMKPYEECFEIVHVHGSFGLPRKEITEPSNLAVEWGQAISVVGQSSVPDEVAADRKRAREMVLQATEIYAAGFSFASQNVEMIGLSKKARAEAQYDPTKLIWLNYDGNAGLKLSVERLKDGAGIAMDISNAVEGSPLKPVSVTDFFAGGYLGEMGV